MIDAFINIIYLNATMQILTSEYSYQHYILYTISPGAENNQQIISYVFSIFFIMHSNNHILYNEFHNQI